MIFLAPVSGLAALVLGTGAVAALHFLKLRRRPVRVSSTLLWSQAARDLQVNAPWRMIRPRLSLLLELLAAAALAGAIAQPVVQGAAPTGSRVAIVVDVSASMAAVDDAGGQTRLDRARTQALDLLERLPAGTETAALALGLPSKLLAGPTRDRSLLREALLGLSPTDQPEDVQQLLQLLETLVVQGAEEGGRQAPWTIVLYSDGGFAAAGQALSAAVGDAQLRFVRVAGDARPFNAGVVDLAAERDFDDPQTLRLVARLAHTAPAPRELTAAVYLDDAPLGALSARAPAPTDGRPGQAVASLTVREPRGGLLRVVLPGGDALTSDDVAYAVVPPASALRVAVVTPAQGQAADPFLLRAIEAAGGGAVETITLAQYEARAQAPLWDLVFFDRCAPAATPTIPSVHIAAAPADAGVTVDGPQGGGTIALWDRRAPALRDVSLERVQLAPGPTLRLEGQAQALAQLEAGPVLARFRRHSVEHLVTSFAFSSSTWPLEPSFAVFIANLLEQLPAGGDRLISRVVSTSQPLLLTPAPGARRVRLVGPVEREIAVPQDADRVSAGRLERVGVYRVQGAREQVVGVSLLSERETTLPQAESVELSGRRVEAQRAETLGERPLWRWLAAAAGLFALLDWALYALAMRVRRSG